MLSLVVVAVAAAALVVALVTLGFMIVERRRRRRHVRRNGNDFVMWDWPLRPIDGHDHPEPPELEHEPAA